MGLQAPPSMYVCAIFQGQRQVAVQQAIQQVGTSHQQQQQQLLLLHIKLRNLRRHGDDDTNL